MEFLCEKCKSHTIFTNIDEIEEFICVGCDRAFKPKNLIRFDQSNDGELSRLVTKEEFLNKRIEEVARRVIDLTDRVERIEELVLEAHCEVVWE